MPRITGAMIERACLDYIEGFYEGDTSKLIRCLNQPCTNLVTGGIKNREISAGWEYDLAAGDRLCKTCF
ncbi:MAG: hypothetical protein IPL50_21090 [Chitinophagaceae bacterium]|nr:hypothetical protein [Chitinophagaceae bacterium]